MSEFLSNPGGPIMGRWEKHFELVLGSATAMVLAFIMLLTCADVAGRYVFSAPIAGGLELTELLMGVLIFTSLPLVTLRQQQVTVDIFEPYIPRFIKPALHWLIHAAGCVCLAVISWRLWVKAGQMRDSGDFTAVLQLDVWPLIYYMSVQSAVTTFVLFLILLQHGRATQSLDT